MKPGISIVLKQLLEESVTIYATGLKANGELFLVDMELGVIGIKQSNNPILIDIATITAIEAENVGDYL